LFRNFLICSAVLVVSVPFFSVWASVPLHFSKIETPADLPYMLREDYKSALPLYMNASDLNGDGLDEVILRLCPELETVCPYKIYALQGDKSVLLGEFSAHSVRLADSSTQGIADLAVYANKMNDYNYTLYIWDPLESRYNKVP